MFLHCSDKPIVAQLGFRFWDPVRNVQVSDGLEVTARTVTTYGRTFQAFQTPSGNFSFRGLPGFHEAEFPSDGFAESRKRMRAKLIIEVNDTRLRFLPVAFLFDGEIPVAMNGMYHNPIFDDVYQTSPPKSGLPVLDLYSAPTRPIMPGMAAVRCSLKEATPIKAAAAHAYIKVSIQGKNWFGIADSEGSAAVYFPYPTVDNSFFGSSPPSPASRTLNSQKWQISVSIGYSPESLTTFPAASLTESGPAGSDHKAPPELGSILGQQRAGIWPNSPESLPGSSPVPELNEELFYGQELVLRTYNTSELLLEIVPTSP